MDSPPDVSRRRRQWRKRTQRCSATLLYYIQVEFEHPRDHKYFNVPLNCLQKIKFFLLVSHLCFSHERHSFRAWFHIKFQTSNSDQTDWRTMSISIVNDVLKKYFDFEILSWKILEFLVFFARRQRQRTTMQFRNRLEIVVSVERLCGVCCKNMSFSQLFIMFLILIGGCLVAASFLLRPYFVKSIYDYRIKAYKQYCKRFLWRIVVSLI